MRPRASRRRPPPEVAAFTVEAIDPDLEIPLKARTAALCLKAPMKNCIYGAGAIGGYLGVQLACAGADISLVARGPHLAAGDWAPGRYPAR
jgi:NADPH-dependent 2,4-dienoyl-CoA reductase/sulfur reductase-like enzyme